MAKVTGTGNNTKTVLGHDLILLMEDSTTAGSFKPVAHASTTGLSFTKNTKERNSKSLNGKMQHFEYSTYNWTASTDGLVSFEAGICNYVELLKASIEERKVKIVVCLNDGSTGVLNDKDLIASKSGKGDDLTAKDGLEIASTALSGECLITQVDINGAAGQEDATFTVSLQGSGELAVYDVKAGITS